MSDRTQDEGAQVPMVELMTATVEIAEGRTVALGRPVDETDDSWYMKFTNEGVETKLRLSGLAMQTLMELYVSKLHQQAAGDQWQHAATVRVAVIPEDSGNE